MVASYGNSTQALTAFGGAQGSATYSLRATGGEIISGNDVGANSSHYRLRPGYVGQGVEVASLTLGFADAPTDLTIKENTSRAVVVTAGLDDGSRSHPQLSAVEWQVVSGALTAPGADGLLGAGPVPVDTSASIESEYLGITARLDVLISDVIAHYSDWLMNYFTSAEIASDPRTLPEASYSGDGYANLLKYALGLNPRQVVTAQPTLLGMAENRLTLSFHRYLRPDLSYKVEASDNLNLWTSIWSAAGETGVTGEVTVFDTATIGGSNPRRFLRLLIEQN
jgi:hypothetical protein